MHKFHVIIKTPGFPEDREVTPALNWKDAKAIIARKVATWVYEPNTPRHEWRIVPCNNSDCQEVRQI